MVFEALLHTFSHDNFDLAGTVTAAEAAMASEATALASANRLGSQELLATFEASS